MINEEIFSEYIADPAAIRAADSSILKAAVEKYPYCQLLHAFHVKSLSGDSEIPQDLLFKAALINPNRNVLWKIIHQAERIRDKNESIKSDFLLAEAAAAELELHQEEEAVEIQEFSSDQTDLLVSPTDTSNVDAASANTNFPLELEDEVGLKANEFETDAMLPISDSTEVEMEQTTTRSEDQDKQDSKDLQDILDSEAQELEGVEDMEITTADSIHQEEAEYVSAETLDTEVSDPVETPREGNIPVAESTHREESQDLNDLINAGIAQNYSLEDNPTENEQVDTTVTAAVAETSETNDVSRYTDDKLPYSFLWWLDKTRREHTQNYQPYASNFKLDISKSISRNAVDPLSSQIIENIFHLQSPIDQLENSPRTVAFQIKRKGDYILEKFIREEPQIKPPDSQKLDTENKARKSSEDPNDLVSETLAQIYTDQMLYHKAIETFKKLSLKFPEKSTYFADQITDLEKKLN